LTEVCIDLTYGNGWTVREIGYEPTIKIDLNPKFPDVIKADFRNLPFPSNFADEIVFDPPFKYLRKGSREWQKKSLGKSGNELNDWGSFQSLQDMLSSLTLAFAEIRRILKTNGHCLFKWGGDRLSFKRVIAFSQMNLVDSIIRQSMGGKTLKVGWFVLEK